MTSIFISNFGIRNKIVSIILLVSISSTLFFSFPQKSNAQWVVTDPGATALLSLISGGVAATVVAQKSLTFKEFILDGVANFAAKMVIQRLTAQTVNWINSGFRGNPAYVENPGQFFLNVGDNVASNFINSTNLSALCTPFNAKVRLALVKNYINEDRQNYACTIGGIVDNYENFTNDFTQGGWDGWFSVTQNDTNNPLGSYNKARNQLNVQIAGKNRDLSDQLNRGMGFLSFKKCKTWENATSNNTSGPIAVDESGQSYDPSGESEGEIRNGKVCTKSEVVTPGSVIAGQLNKSLGSTFDGLVGADEINEIIGALMQQLVTKVASSIGNGLRGASESTSGQASLIQQINTAGQEGSVDQTAFVANTTNTAPREVVPGNTPPVITLNGPSVVILSPGESFIDPGAIVNDLKDGSKIITGDGVVNTSVPGGYALTYTARNSLGLDAATVVRSIIVRDQDGTDPTINNGRL